MANADPPSRQTLEEIPSRVFKFLMAIVEVPAIASAMALRGYKQSDHDYAASRVSRLAVVPAGVLEPTIDRKVREAVVELDAWDEPNFAAIKATLDRLHPEQSEYVFENLEPKQGPEAVISVGTLLDRLDDLDHADARQSTRVADHAALATLAGRGYPAEERERLRGLIKKANTVVVVPPVSGDERRTIQLELYAWLTDWSASARLVISRRDHLIRLGLAKRRVARKAPAGGGGGDSGDGGDGGDSKSGDAGSKSGDAGSKSDDAGSKSGDAGSKSGDAGSKSDDTGGGSG